MILLGKSFFNSLAPYTQYLAFFSEMSSMLENEGYFFSISVVALKIRGATLVI